MSSAAEQVPLGGLAQAARDTAPDTMFPTVEQLDMLGDGQVPGRTGVARLRHARRMGERGRPPGAQNKRNARVAQWFVAKYGDPLSACGEIMAMPPDALVTLMIELQGGDAKHKAIKAIDVLRLKLEAASIALPYVHGKQPLSVEVTGRKDAIIIVPGLNVPGDVSLNQLESELEQFGLAALDPDTMRLLPSDAQPEDAEFSDVDEDPST